MLRALVLTVSLLGCGSSSPNGNPDGQSLADSGIPDPNGTWSMVVSENPTGCSSVTVVDYAAGTVTIANRHLEAQLFAFDQDVNTHAGQLCSPDGGCPPGVCPGSNRISLDIDENSYASGSETSTDTCGPCNASVPIPAYRFHIDPTGRRASVSLNSGVVVLTRQ